MRNEDLWHSRLGTLCFFVTLLLLVMFPELSARWVLLGGILGWIFASLLLSLFARWRAQSREARRIYRDGWSLLAHVRASLARYPHRLHEEARRELREAAKVLESALRQRQADEAQAALIVLDDHASRHFAFARKSVAREYAEVIGAALFFAVTLRAFVVEAFRIPTGSMIPTLQIGDRIFVNKFIYGLRLPFTDLRLFTPRAPRRGEIVVFSDPTSPEKDLIKRVIGVPGDNIEIISDQIFLNGQKLSRELLGTAEWTEHSDVTGQDEVFVGRRYVETLDGLSYEVRYDLNLTNEVAVHVPEDSVFVMGDNRDNSQDSRFFGTVSLESVKGRALFVWWNSDSGPLDRVGTPIR
jgi:signal peptidase I